MTSTRCCGIIFLLAIATAWGDEFPVFDGRVLDEQVGEVCYAVTAADINGDGRLDAVAVSERSVVWYENPEWSKHVLIDDATPRDNVCIAAGDVDRDGHVDFALGAGWPNGDGSIFWLHRDQPADLVWHSQRIGNEPSLHRMRFADVLGLGANQLVISPLNKSSGPGVRVTAFAIPQRPAADRWIPHVLDENLNRMHNHWHCDWDQDGRNDTLTASQEGIHWIRRSGDNWKSVRLVAGNSSNDPIENGAGEIKVATTGQGMRCLVTIEPMHGNQVVVYVPSGTNQSDGDFQRVVIETEFRRGHALAVANLDDDSADEIIAGHSDLGVGSVKGPGLFVYDSQDAEGLVWKRHVVDDGGIATEDAIAADFDGDGRVDILAGGRATKNLKLYLNRGPIKK